MLCEASRGSSEDVVVAVVVGRELSETFGLLLLVGDVAQAVVQSGDLAEPLHLVGFLGGCPGSRGT